MVTLASAGTGQAALAVGSLAPLPALTLTIAQDDLPASENAASDGAQIEAGISAAVQSWERVVWLEGFVDGSGDWDLALDDLLDAIRRALVTYPRPLRYGGAVFGAPETGGPQKTASLKMTLTIKYMLDYSNFS